MACGPTISVPYGPARRQVCSSWNATPQDRRGSGSCSVALIARGCAVLPRIGLSAVRVASRCQQRYCLPTRSCQALAIPLGKPPDVGQRRLARAPLVGLTATVCHLNRLARRVRRRFAHAVSCQVQHKHGPLPSSNLGPARDGSVSGQLTGNRQVQCPDREMPDPLGVAVRSRSCPGARRSRRCDDRVKPVSRATPRALYRVETFWTSVCCRGVRCLNRQGSSRWLSGHAHQPVREAMLPQLNGRYAVSLLVE